MAIDRILDESAAARGGVRSVQDHIWNCTATNADARALRRAIVIRARLARRAAELSVDQLPGGRAMRADLVEFLQLSSDANRYYLKWQAAMADCRVSAYRDVNFQEGRRLSRAATSMKGAFVSEWNDIATTYALEVRAADEL